MTESDFDTLLHTLLEQITLVPFNDFEQEYPSAILIMESIDENDAPFLAVGLALRLDGIWTKRPAFSPTGSHQSISHERSFLKIFSTLVWSKIKKDRFTHVINFVSSFSGDDCEKLPDSIIFFCAGARPYQPPANRIIYSCRRRTVNQEF